MEFDAAGNLFIADRDGARVRKVDVSTGIITTVAGTGTPDYGVDGRLATADQLELPHGLALDAAGNLFIVSRNRIRKVDVSTGIITTVAGGGLVGDGGPATSARLYNPFDVAVDAGGNLFIVDHNANNIRKVDALGIITTVAGSGLGFDGFIGDGGLATSALLKNPNSVAVDAAGNLFIADFGNNRVRKVNVSTGIITTVAGGGLGDDGGPATDALVNGPNGVAVDAAGNLFISQYNAGRIRKVDVSTGIITTISSSVQVPLGLAFDRAGDLFVTSGVRVLKLSAGLTLSTSASPTCTTTSMASVTASAGTAPYSYTWAAPAGITITGGGSTSTVSVSAGAGVSGVQTLTVTVADAATPSLTATAQVSLTFNAPPANPSLVHYLHPNRHAHGQQQQRRVVLVCLWRHGPQQPQRYGRHGHRFRQRALLGEHH